MKRGRRKKLVHKPFAKVKGRMVELGYTNETLAERIGINRSTLNEKINGKADFRFSELAKLIDVLNIKPEWMYDYFFDPELRKT